MYNFFKRLLDITVSFLTLISRALITIYYFIIQQFMLIIRRFIKA